MKITVDRTKCEGYAKCVQAAPKVFRLDTKMIAEVIDPKADNDEKIVLAAKICPTKAIIVEEEGTGKRIFPSEQAPKISRERFLSRQTLKAAPQAGARNRIAAGAHASAFEFPNIAWHPDGSPARRGPVRAAR